MEIIWIIALIFIGVTAYTFGYDNGFCFALKMAKLRLTENGELVKEDYDGRQDD
jgi:hypothetical protein